MRGSEFKSQLAREFPTQKNTIYSCLFGNKSKIVAFDTKCLEFESRLVRFFPEEVLSSNLRLTIPNMSGVPVPQTLYPMVLEKLIRLNKF